MSNKTIALIGGVLCIGGALFGGKLESIDLGQWVPERQGAPTAEVIDTDAQLRHTCAFMAAQLPDLEKIDSTNDVVDFVESGFTLAFTGATMPATVDVITEEIAKALKFGEESQAVTQAERVEVAKILARHAQGEAGG